MSDSVLVERGDDGTAVVTLNRPDVRNAIDPELLRGLRTALRELDADDAVGAIVLTGADPAFCAGLDLRRLGSADGGLLDGAVDRSVSRAPWGEPLRTPLIGAVNGAAVTGGLEIALNCDILIASERARFAGTHARVGVLPGWRLSVLLPLFVGAGLDSPNSRCGPWSSPIVFGEDSHHCYLSFVKHGSYAPCNMASRHHVQVSCRNHRAPRLPDQGSEPDDQCD